MPGVTRRPDNCSGHGCYPPRPSASWSPDVFANGLEVERYSDALQVHCCDLICHGGSWVGIRLVFTNNLVQQAQGDPIDCGSVGNECSPDVFADP